MNREIIEKSWKDIESRRADSSSDFQRLVCVGMLYRVYIGMTGIPGCRFISIEIPDSTKKDFNSFKIPQGFDLSIANPIVQHDGFVACILRASASDMNEVFTIVAEDILSELCKQPDAGKYVAVLKARIEEWRTFFKNPERKILSDDEIIGLTGELSFINDLRENGIFYSSLFWNGPIRSAQDFQGSKFAAEVKATAANKLESVRISGEMQLDTTDGNRLFLVAYRVERNDKPGHLLPDLIQETADLLPETLKDQFWAKLLCSGYSPKDRQLYTKGYEVKECRMYRVTDGFPRLVSSMLPNGISKLQYKLDLQTCESYLTNINEISSVIKEENYGEA